MNYYPYIENSNRFWRLENIAFEIGRANAHFDDPTILTDIIKARMDNDEAVRDLSEKLIF